MTDDINEVISLTVNRVIMELKKQKLLNSENITVSQRIERLLYNYNYMGNDEDKTLSVRIKQQIDKSLSSFNQSDVDLIRMKYFEGLTHESIAEKLNCDVSTISRRKNKLISKLGFMLFTDDAIQEILFT